MPDKELLTFGPVPSRRLGQSLGINNIPPKICTYACVYCQVGNTSKMRVNRREFYETVAIVQSAEKKVDEATKRNERINYLTFVPDGEPTLDCNLGREIAFLKQLGMKVAVISNSSLIWKNDVKDDLCDADWVSLKIDTVAHNTWHAINRPHRSLEVDRILQGILDFSNVFTGELTTETMLINNINDTVEELEKIAEYLAVLKPAKSYISIPTRPPAETWVKSPPERAINMAYQIFRERGIDTEYLIGYEGNAFAFTGNVEEDLLSITSVHPMREDGVREYLRKANAGWKPFEKLLVENKLKMVKYGNKHYYVRNIQDIKRIRTKG